MNWKISTNVEGLFPCLELAGYIDIDAGNELKSLGESLLAAGHKKLALDFSKCRLINSSGLAVILDFIVTFVEDFDGKVGIIAEKRQIIDVFKMVRITQFASIFSSLDEAVKWLNE